MINWGFAAVAAPRYPFQSFFCDAEKRISTTIANPSLMKLIFNRKNPIPIQQPAQPSILIHLSIVNYPVNCQLSTVNCPLNTIFVITNGHP